MDYNLSHNNNILLNENDKPKPKTKLEKYIKERKEIVNKIFTIINIQIDENMRFFYSDEITEEKQNDILSLKNNIKKYFIISNWMSFKTDVKIDKEYMSLIRNILKHENIKYTISQKMINGIKKTKYILLDNNEI